MTLFSCLARPGVAPDEPGPRRYVGLKNQGGTTCHLNTVLQALYMTPEFRKALYNWEYNEEFYIEADKCIPFQLQIRSAPS